MSSFHLVNVWTDAEAGPGGFVPMADSLLWQPDDFRSGHPAPAFVIVHGWGSYPDNDRAEHLGPLLADAGFVCLSLCLRRRGMEGQLNSMPDDDLRDIKLAIDFLHTTGCRRIFLLGVELGGYSALRYLARHRDRRVAGLAWADPIPAPADWLRTRLKDGEFEAALGEAGLAARQGAGMDHRIDLFPEAGPAVTQNALAFLAWWAPDDAAGLARNLADTSLQPRVYPGGQALPAELEALAVADAPEDDLVDWAIGCGVALLRPVRPELVHVAVAGQRLAGLLWRPADGGNTRNVTLLVHGLTSTPFSALLQQMAPVLAQSDMAVLAVGLRRSGWAGHESSVLDNDVEDLAAWSAWLAEAGFDRIVLAGASIGSISVGRYLSLSGDPKVVAVAHLMPTAECPTWYRQAAGEGAYMQAVERARMAIAEGRGDTELIDVDVRQPPPGRFGSRFRWTQRAASWLSWWGPDADSRNLVHIASASVPVLLLSGTADSYNNEARFAELRNAAVHAPSVSEIWYPDIDHGLAGVEQQTARDMLAWLQRSGVI